MYYIRNIILVTALLPNWIRKTSAVSGIEREHVHEEREQYGRVSKYPMQHFSERFAIATDIFANGTPVIVDTY